MIREIRQGILFTVVTMVLLGGVYHAVLWGIGRALFPEFRAADPSLGAKPVVRAHASEQRTVPIDDDGAFALIMDALTFFS